MRDNLRREKSVLQLVTMTELVITSRTNAWLLRYMKKHYSQPKGFVGRNICYAILDRWDYYGHIVGGSATRFLPGRNEFFDIEINNLNHIVNNTFFHIERVNGKYPRRNFVPFVIKMWRERMVDDWENKYGDEVIGFETLVKLPLTGEVYKRDGWTEVGTTIGYSCKREGGRGTDNWSGKRVWDTKNLQPKRVFVREV